MLQALKLLGICFFILLLTTFAPDSKALADQNFSNNIDVTYTVSENGTTHVVFNTVLQNTSDKYYASSYTLKVGFDTLHNVSAFDSNGAIKPAIKTINGGKSITLPFNRKAIGLNSQVNFTLSFDTPNVASHVGSIWEINIPGLENQSDFKKFAVHLRVPQSFGRPSYVKPVQSGNSLDFDKDMLGSSGISVAFGQEQAYDFTLYYHLQNQNLFPVKTEIALPPSTNYQDVRITDISPKPTNVTIDTDGNWLAAFTLLPSQKITVTAKGTSYLFLIPKQETLSEQQKKIYLQEQPYWQVSNESIKKLANDLKTPQAIFDYVVGHLHYDFSRVAGKQERLGAASVLHDSESAVCLEFTDLFIALARSAGIPAREVDGFAYTENAKQRPLSLVKDILHAWPEYYDSDRHTWIMVDPTWANTTHGIDYFSILDFDHFAFAIKGSKSTYPVAAGGYKLSGNEDTKDVFVSFGTVSDLPSPKASVRVEIAPTFFAGVPISGKILLTNADTVLVPKQTITVETQQLLPHKQQLVSQTIPPFGFLELPMQFKSKSLLTNEKETITIQVAGNTITKTVSVYPFFFQKAVLGGIIVAILGFIIFIIASKAWRVFIS